MDYVCIRFNTNQERNQVRDSIKNRSKNLSVLENGAPDCLVHRAVQLQTSHSREFQGALHYNSPDCPVSQRSNGSLRANGHLPPWTVHVRSQRAPECPVWRRTVRCSKMTRRSNGQLLQTLMDSWRGRASDNEQWSVRCAHRQQPSQRLWKWLGAINTPQPPHS
jgi:hypothetical protein